MKAKAIVTAALKRCFRPKEVLPADKWVEENIRLSPRTSNIAGRYSLRVTPYLKRIYQDISDPKVRRIALKKSGQIGASQLGANTVLYYVCNHTLPALMVFPSESLAKQYSERCFTPTLENCKAAQRFIPDDPDAITKTQFLFDSCIFRIIGGGSASKLSSNAAALLIADEVDKYADLETRGEANPLSLLEIRAITYPHDKKFLIMSTPTDANTSVIEGEYQRGSQSKYFVTCPHCSGAQVLDFNQVKWPAECKRPDGQWDLDAVERLAFYQCPICEGHVFERDKPKMVEAGEWRDTNPNAFPSENRSYHISALYSYAVTWGSLAKLFLLAKGDSSQVRNFRNSYLGEVFEQQAATITDDALTKVVETSPQYVKGEIPKTPEILLMGADVQGNRLYWSIIAGFEDDTLALVDYGQAASHADLAEIFKRQYPVKDNPQSIYGCRYAVIDAGFKTEDAYDLHFRSGRQFIPCFGRTKKHGLTVPVRDDTLPYKGGTVRYLHVNDSFFKERLLLTYIKENTGGLWLPQDICPDFVKQMTSTKLVERKGKNGLDYEWDCPSRNDHYLDAVKYSVALHYRLEQILRNERLGRAANEQPKRQYVSRSL